MDEFRFTFRAVRLRDNLPHLFGISANKVSHRKAAEVINHIAGEKTVGVCGASPMENLVLKNPQNWSDHIAMVYIEESDGKLFDLVIPAEVVNEPL